MSAVMTAPGEVEEPIAAPAAKRRGAGARMHGALGAVPTFVLWLLVALWSVPTLGVLVSSFRDQEAVRSSGWWEAVTDPQFTVENYQEVFDSSGSDLNMGQHFLNSALITIPATVIPVALAAFAAYAF